MEQPQSQASNDVESVPHEPVRTPSKMDRGVTRTPSPTPSEQRALAGPGKPSFKKLLQRENRVKVIVALVVIAMIVLVNVFQKPIVRALEPAANWIHRTPAAWIIPIAIIILLSVPPLFGQEIVCMFIGLTWGPGIGMAVASAGTLLGELGTFYLFKWLLRDRAAGYEAKDIEYAVLARVIRNGGIKVATIARYSIIPNHIMTALFSTCGISLFVFVASAVLSLLKVFVNVYVGYALRLQVDGHSTTTSNVVNYVDIGVSAVITGLAGHYMRKLQDTTKPLVIYERRKRRQAASAALAQHEAGPTMPQHASLTKNRSATSLKLYSAESSPEVPRHSSTQQDSLAGNSSVLSAYPPLHRDA